MLKVLVREPENLKSVLVRIGMVHERIRVILTWIQENEVLAIIRMAVTIQMNLAR